MRSCSRSHGNRCFQTSAIGVLADRWLVRQPVSPTQRRRSSRLSAPDIFFPNFVIIVFSNKPIRIGSKRSQIEKTPVIKRLTIVCIGALLERYRRRPTLSAGARCLDPAAGPAIPVLMAALVSAGVRRCRGCRGRCRSRCRRRLRSGLELKTSCYYPPYYCYPPAYYQPVAW